MRVDTVISLPGKENIEEWTVTDVQTVIQNKGKTQLPIYTLLEVKTGRNIRLTNSEIQANISRINN